MPGQFPKGLNEIYLGHYDLVINLSCRELPEQVDVPLRRWSIQDPIRQAQSVYTHVAENIETQVRELIEEIRHLRAGWHVAKPRPGQPIELPLAPPLPLYADRERAAISPYR